MFVNFGPRQPQSTNSLLKTDVQRRATRFILGYPAGMNYKDRLLKLNILPLEYRREIADIVLLKKSKLGLTCINHSDYFRHVSESKYKTRNFDPRNYEVKFAKQTYLKNSYFYRVVSLWNSLPKNIKEITRINSLKNNLVIFYKKNP